MRRLFLMAAATLALGCGGGAARATTVADPQGDFLSGYTGLKTADLDVLSFSVDYSAIAQQFTLGATFAGAIDPSSPGFYVIGVDTGAGALHPFGPVGEGNVLFDQALSIQKTGAGSVTVNGTPMTFTATISGATLSMLIPLSLLPSTGFTPQNYGFNIWPRQVTGGLLALADFAPDNSTISAGVPEPGTWALLMLGVGLSGAALRMRRRPGMIVASKPA